MFIYYEDWYLYPKQSWSSEDCWNVLIALDFICVIFSNISIRIDLLKKKYNFLLQSQCEFRSMEVILEVLISSHLILGHLAAIQSQALLRQPRYNSCLSLSLGLWLFSYSSWEGCGVGGRTQLMFEGKYERILFTTIHVVILCYFPNIFVISCSISKVLENNFVLKCVVTL